MDLEILLSINHQRVRGWLYDRGYPSPFLQMQTLVELLYPNLQILLKPRYPSSSLVLFVLGLLLEAEH